MKTILLVFLLIYYTCGFVVAQQFSKDIPETREIILNTGDTIKKIRIFIANPPVAIKADRFYAWYQKQLLLHTQGAWSGKLLQGKYEAFYPNHNLLEQGRYEKGWKVGLWKHWYPNGTLKENNYWVNGLQQGASERFANTGKLLERATYRRGRLHGRFELVNSKQQVVERRTYKKGQQKGGFKVFDEQGQLLQKGTYKNGRLHGTLSTFSEGETTTVRYKKGAVLLKKNTNKKIKRETPKRDASKKGAKNSPYSVRKRIKKKKENPKRTSKDKPKK